MNDKVQRQLLSFQKAVPQAPTVNEWTKKRSFSNSLVASEKLPAKNNVVEASARKEWGEQSKKT